jgi:two-component system alkaline phosphatase synthesis response regulator PhoP
MIFVLEDEENIRNLVIYTLQTSGLETQGFENAGAFWQAVKKHVPDLVLLDIMLPDEDGMSVLSRLREAPATAKLPVIMLTAKGAEIEKVKALDAGADDYITKPFGMMEMQARVKSLLRRAQTDSGERDKYKIEGLVVNVPHHVVTVDGEAVALTTKEFDLLAYLLRNRGIVLTREKLMLEIWGQDYFGETRTVDVHIRTLRSKLLNYETLIETVRGVGYKIRGKQ